MLMKEPIMLKTEPMNAIISVSSCADEGRVLSF